jgi:hypothetical protein
MRAARRPPPGALRTRRFATACSRSGAILASVGWLAQAVIVFAAGWSRRSAFLRWMALALLGLTLLKFVLVDLAHADPFWRFLTALLAGAAMLALSFVYQRLGAGRRSGAERTPVPRPAGRGLTGYRVYDTANVHAWLIVDSVPLTS